MSQTVQNLALDTLETSRQNTILKIQYYEETALHQVEKRAIDELGLIYPKRMYQFSNRPVKLR